MNTFKIDTSAISDRFHDAWIKAISHPDNTISPKIILEKPQETDEAAKTEDEWIWVSGYKATERDMTCQNNYQFEMNKKFDMPAEARIATCHSGFHFCPNLKDVFGYRDICNGRRYFEVSGLVRKSDVDNLGNAMAAMAWFSDSDKLAAKSIIFTRELSVDEVLKAKGVDFSTWSEDDKAYAMEHGVNSVAKRAKVRALVELGYSEAFAHWIVKRDKYDSAYAVGTQKDLSMDMKVMVIMGV